ncbi:MAG: aldo/keto reductase [Myxococcota bacterium]
MRRARLGSTDLEISTLVYGSMGRSRQDETTRARVLDAAIEAGMTSIDTAPLYDFGEVESFLGRALAGRRDRVELLSKVGLRWDDEHGEILFSFEQAGTRRHVRRDSRPTSIRRDVEESLTRLRTDRLDLCQIHHPDRRIPLDDALGELARLREEGKIRALGVSNVEAHELATALAFFEAAPAGSVLASLQLHASLLERRADEALLPAATAADLGVLAYTPLEGGALSSRFVTDARWRAQRAAEADPLFATANARAIGRAIETCLAPVARDAAVPESAVALAWLLARPGITAPIVGASSEAQVAANAAAWDVVLPPASFEAIGAGFAALELEREPAVSLAGRLRHRVRRLRERIARLRGGR